MNLISDEVKECIRVNPVSFRRSLMEVEEEREIIHAIYQLDPNVNAEAVIAAIKRCRIDLLEAVKKELGLGSDHTV